MINVNIENVGLTGGKLHTLVFPFGHELSRGVLPNRFHRRIIGYNDAVGTTLEDITDTSANIVIPTTAVAVEMDSTSGDDASGGTGIQEVEVHGLDGNFDEVSERVEMNGTTAVAITQTFIRINNIHAMRVGSGGVAAGEVTVQGSGGGQEYGRIGAGGNTMLQCLFTIPANHKGFVEAWTAGGTTKDSRIVLRATRDWDDTTLTVGVFQSQDVIVTSSATTFRPFPIPIALPPKCDVKVSGQALVAGAQISASIDLWYERIFEK